MEPVTAPSEDTLALWQQARHSLVRYLLGISRHLQSCMMETLQVQCGHDQLRLGFAPYVTLIGERNIRPSELAEQLGITRQACNQTVRQLESAEYVGHVADPDDGRAKLLTLSEKGQRLRRDGIRVVGDFDRQFAGFSNVASAAAGARTLRELAGAFTPTNTRVNVDATGYEGLAALLPRLADYIIQRLMELTRAKGHPGLKLSFGQVIPLIGPEGGRIQRIAALQDVSKQAISVIAIELEELGYLSRQPDPQDARQIILRFTDLGIRLMNDAAGCVAELETEFAAVVGADAMKQLAAVLESIFNGLDLQAGDPDQSETVDLQLLAQQLRQQLGLKRSQSLARLLSSPA